ncbi:hypothetical protein [Paenibacillus silvisoli]|uniref:hypothetical protein n=1 Tax=Paenibacillus silvisoli TaxID=3110539 RepID=UPI002804B2C2|nr:hypothetical protein [Paenibacillus silvisoli]
MARTARTTALLVSIGEESGPELSTNFDLAATLTSQGNPLPPQFTLVTVQRGTRIKEKINTFDSFEDDPPGNILRLPDSDIAFFGLRANERIIVEYNAKTNIMTLRSLGAK